MPDESIDEVAPTFRFRMRCVALPIEDAVLRGGKRLRSETELDKRPDVPSQQVIVKLVNLRPVVDGPAIFDSHCSQHIVKDGVESYIAKAKLIDRGLELGLAVVANQRAWIIGPNRQIEEAIHRPCRSFDIHDNGSRNSRLRSGSERQRAGSHEETGGKD